MYLPFFLVTRTTTLIAPLLLLTWMTLGASWLVLFLHWWWSHPPHVCQPIFPEVQMATESSTSTRHSSTTTWTTMTTTMASIPPAVLTVPEHLRTSLPIHTQPLVIIITSTLEVRKGRRKKIKWFAQVHSVHERHRWSVHARLLPPSPVFTSHSPASAPRTMAFKTFCDKVAGVSPVPFINLHTHDR